MVTWGHIVFEMLTGHELTEANLEQWHKVHFKVPAADLLLRAYPNLIDFWQAALANNLEGPSAAWKILERIFFPVATTTNGTDAHLLSPAWKKALAELSRCDGGRADSRRFV